jgi:protein SCO1/2
VRQAEPSHSLAYRLARNAVVLLALVLIATSSAFSQELARAQRLEALTDQFGKPFSVAAIAGRPYALFFGFTYCPDVCPTTLLQMSNLLQRLGSNADRVTILFVTVDPERDTPEQIKSYLTSFDPRIIGLTGTSDHIRAVAAAWRAAYDRIDEENGAYTIAHSAHVYLMDRSGRQIGTMNFQDDEAAQMEKLRQLIASP